MTRSCQNNPNSFRYICGKVVLKWQMKPVSQFVSKFYELCFGCKIGDHEGVWVPKICCSSCSRALAGWLKGTHKSVPFALPIVWREPEGCLNDCYFCLTKITAFSRFSMRKIKYPNTPFVLRSVPRDDSVPLPKLPKA
jgi:hypothetical protein